MAYSRQSGQRRLGDEQGNEGGDRCQYHERRHQAKALIATTSACMLPIPSRILQAHGGQYKRRVLGREAASEPVFLPLERGSGQNERRWRQVMDIAGRRFLV